MDATTRRRRPLYRMVDQRLHVSIEKWTSDETSWRPVPKRDPFLPFLRDPDIYSFRFAKITTLARDDGRNTLPMSMEVSNRSPYRYVIGHVITSANLSEYSKSRCFELMREDLPRAFGARLILSHCQRFFAYYNVDVKVLHPLVLG